MAFQELDKKLILEWYWEKNVGLAPRLLNVKAKTRLWWICANGHQWPARLDHRKRGSGCSYCAGLLLTNNTLAHTHPAVANQWHPNKNG